MEGGGTRDVCGGEALSFHGRFFFWFYWVSVFVHLFFGFYTLFSFLFFSFILLTKFVFYSSYDWSRLLPCNRLLHLVDVCLNNYRGKRGKMFLVLANDMKL